MTPGAFQSAEKGAYDAFVCKLPPAGNSISYCTLLGGEGTDAATSVMALPTGQTLVGGYTTSSQFPTVQASQSFFAGSFDGFVSLLNPGGTGLDFSTYQGGSGEDRLYQVVASGSTAYAGGWTSSGTGGSYDGFLVAISGLSVSAAPPSAVSVTPGSGSGSAQTFAFTFTDSNGAADIVTAKMDINAALVPNNACYLSYTRASNTITLADNAGAWQTALTVGSAGTSQNSQCTLNAGASSVSASGNTLTLNLALTFASAFAGSKNIYMEVRNANMDSDWSQKGTWTVPSGGSTYATMSAVSVTPGSGSGSAQTFAFTFTDSKGAADIVTAKMDINAALVPNNACYLSYTRASNTITLADNAGAWQTALTVGSAGTSQNSQCTLNAGASSVSASGNTLTLNLALSFASAFAGSKNIYMEVRNANMDSDWSQKGTWTVPSGGSTYATMSAVSVTPGSGSGSAQTFAFTFTDSNGAADIVTAKMDINAALVPNNACYLSYTRASNTITLADNAGAWQTALTVGSAGTSQNSQCTLNAGASSVSASGNTLTLNLALTFASAFAGSKNIYMEVRNANMDSDWSQKGTWTVPSGGSTYATMSAVSVTPGSGSGSAQTFAFTFTDSNGAADIVTAKMDINAALVPNNACYLSYTRASNTITLADNAGAWQTALTVGSAGTSQNSQCTLNAGASSVSASGNTLTLNLALTFASAFAGSKNIYMEVRNANIDSDWSQKGTWTVPGTPMTPSVVSVTPSIGNGRNQTFAFTFSDPGGVTGIVTAKMDINAALVPNNACYLSYTRASNTVTLADDAGAWQTALTVGNAGTSQNSQCTLNAGASSVSASGNTLTLNLALSFASAFAGSKNIYMDVRNANVDSDWSQKGTWTVP